MKTVPRYICEVCESEYEEPGEASACEARGFKPSFSVGDVVVGHYGFGWFDGDERWVSNHGVIVLKGTPGHACENGDSNCFGPCCTYGFFYVVTFVDGDDFHLRWRERFGARACLHRPRYHLATLAMVDNGYQSGYTFDEGHHRMTKVPHPPAHVLETMAPLLGLKAGRLL